MNLFSEEERLETLMDCVYEAVQRNSFSHLSIEQIKQPSPHYFDAKLARQIAITIMNREFLVPRNRITKMMGRQRTSTSFAIRTVDYRLDDDCFRVAYDRMTERAAARYERESGEAWQVG